VACDEGRKVHHVNPTVSQKTDRIFTRVSAKHYVFGLSLSSVRLFVQTDLVTTISHEQFFL